MKIEEQLSTCYSALSTFYSALLNQLFVRLDDL